MGVPGYPESSLQCVCRKTSPLRKSRRRRGGPRRQDGSPPPDHRTRRRGADVRTPRPAAAFTASAGLLLKTPNPSRWRGERGPYAYCMGEAQPSLVRARILRDHGVLRAKLEQLQRLALEAGGGSSAAAERAVELARALFEELADHLDIEEQVLVPMLREADAWGELRAGELARHHETQWQELKELRARADSSSVLALAAELAALVMALRSDMLAEDARSSRPTCCATTCSASTSKTARLVESRAADPPVGMGSSRIGPRWFRSCFDAEKTLRRGRQTRGHCGQTPFFAARAGVRIQVVVCRDRKSISLFISSCHSRSRSRVSRSCRWSRRTSGRATATRRCSQARYRCRWRASCSPTTRTVCCTACRSICRS